MTIKELLILFLVDYWRFWFKCQPAAGADGNLVNFISCESIINLSLLLLFK